MKRTLTLSLAAAAMIVGGSAIAQDRGPGKDRTHTRAEAQERATKMFAKLDVNNDGVISAADREARARAHFDKIDTDGNGQISFAEMSAAHDAKRENAGERRGKRGERAGADGSEGHHRMGRGGGKHGGEMIARADADGNGAVTQAEFTAAALARFDKADANGDGTITADEMRSKMREKRGQQPAG